MCGFAGVVRSDGPIDDATAVATRLDAALAHRGPDGRGCWVSPDRHVLLVHRRLAIIDPGPDGAQPMSTPDGSHQLVFNGEVYNYRELRRELEGRGERFSTASDTEVLLCLVARDGPAALSRVRGMFALACWSARDRTLLLARDRFGIKPLYLAATRAQVAFASELSALTAAGLVERTPSPAGVLAFLSWGHIPPPLTRLQGVEALTPGTWRRWHADGRMERGVFADARAAYVGHADRSTSESALRERTGAALRDSVAAHLVADVPVGIFLSGGIDSASLVSAAVSSGATNLQTFTVTFDDATSEAVPAGLVAAAFGTRHHEVRVEVGDVTGDWPSLLRSLDQPSIDGVNAYYVAKAVAGVGIKAVMSGTGGDELFGGYPSFRRLPRAKAWQRRLSPALAYAGSTVGRTLPARLQPRWRHLLSTDGDIAELYRVQRGFLMPAEIAAMAGPALTDPAVWSEASGALRAAEDALLGPIASETALARVASMETRLYLGSQLLRDIDAMSMAHGLEVRVPFVDDRMLAAVWPALGFHPQLMSHKRLLHETLQHSLPTAIVRRPKQGFTLPFARWMHGDLAPVVRSGIDRLAADGWVTADTPDRVWQAWRAGTAHWTRPWGLGVLGHSLSAAAQ